MSRQPGGNKEFEILQQEVVELGKSRRKSEFSGDNNLSQDRSGEKTAGEGKSRVENYHEFTQSFSELTHDLAVEIEGAAKEHPALAILGAFTLGIIVGQLVSRK